MRDYVLSSETFNDLPFSYLEENDVKYIGARYTLGDTEYTAATKQDLDCKTFYDRLRKGEMPHTTQVGVEEATNMFEQIVAQGKDVLHIAFSSGLSGTYQAFRIAADEVMERHPECKIRVIDSLSASMGQGLMVEYCIRQKKAGMEMTALADRLEQERQRFIHMFTVDDLSHLHRGGRVSKLSAIVGGALGIKPILHVDENGKLIPIGKVRGRKQSLMELAAYMDKKYDRNSDMPVFISHGDTLGDAEFLAEIVRERFGVQDIRIGEVGPVIGAHSGPGTIALFFIGSDRMP